MYHELSLIVLGDIASGCGWLQQPCHADVGLGDSGHLLLHAGVPLRSTTCLKTHRPYGAGLPHHTPSRQRTTPPPLAVMAVLPLRNEAIRHLLRPWGSPLSSLRVIARRNDEAIHLCQIHVRFNYVEIEDSAEPMQSICFKKKRNTYISFPVTYPTANDYSRLQTFVQRLGLDRHCIFAAINILNLQLWKHQNTLKASQLKKREAKNVLL